MEAPLEHFSGLQVMFKCCSFIILFLKQYFSRCFTEDSPKIPGKSEKHKIHSPSSLQEHYRQYL